MEKDDLKSVYDLSCLLHADLPESESVLTEKLRLSPQSCWCLIEADRIVGYAFTHPWLLRHIPALDHFLDEIPAKADCLYLHDIALLPQMRGRGALRDLFHLVLGAAKQFNLLHLALTCVHGYEALWAHYGFMHQEQTHTAAALATYGEGACYMIRDLSARME